MEVSPNLIAFGNRSIHFQHTRTEVDGLFYPALWYCAWGLKSWTSSSQPIHRDQTKLVQQLPLVNVAIFHTICPLIYSYARWKCKSNKAYSSAPDAPRMYTGHYWFNIGYLNSSVCHGLWILLMSSIKKYLLLKSCTEINKAGIALLKGKPGTEKARNQAHETDQKDTELLLALVLVEVSEEALSSFKTNMSLGNNTMNLSPRNILFLQQRHPIADQQNGADNLVGQRNGIWANWASNSGKWYLRQCYRGRELESSTAGVAISWVDILASRNWSYRTTSMSAFILLIQTLAWGPC